LTQYPILLKNQVKIKRSRETLNLTEWLKNPQEHPALIPGSRQGIWETRINSRTSEGFTTIRSWLRVDLVPGILDPEKQSTREKYLKANWSEPLGTLQLESLKAYSNHNYRPINSIELVYKTRVSHIIHRIVITDSRGVPIKYSSLEPYTIEELSQFVEASYTEWIEAGGYIEYRKARDKPPAAFWFDLWKIVELETPIILEWLQPEVKQLKPHQTSVEEEAPQEDHQLGKEHPLDHPTLM